MILHGSPCVSPKNFCPTVEVLHDIEACGCPVSRTWFWSTCNLQSIALGPFLHSCTVCGSHGERGLAVGTSPRQCCWSYIWFCLDFYRLSGSYSPIPLPFPTLSRNLSRFLRSTGWWASIKVSCFRLISIPGSFKPEYPLALASAAWTLSLWLVHIRFPWFGPNYLIDLLRDLVVYP